MAYTEKYFIAFCNPLGQSCRISIQENGFAGIATELVGQQEPIIIQYDNSDDFKFKAIIESEASINLVFDDAILSFSELWESNERTFLVKYTIDDILEWSGFIIPDGFDYNLKGGLYDAVLTARDGLSTLEGILFKTDNNEFYGFQDFGYNNRELFPFILVLTEILRKLDLGIDIWTLVDYYEQTMVTLNDNTRESDPLSLAYVNVKTYINDTDREDVAYFEDINEAWDCQKIIENICNIWGSRLYQQNGVWRLKSIHADSVIASGYIPPVDSFVGTNPTQSGASWKYETYFSPTKEIDLLTSFDLYSAHDTVALNDKMYNDAALTSLADAGFHLIKGVDEVLEIGIDGVVLNITAYHSVVDAYYWKKYNNTAGYLGRELADNGTLIPCSNKDTFLKDNDAVVRMDKVYKQFRVNFDYTFIRVGDSPVNLLQNGNFALPFDQYGQLEAPPNWERWREGTNRWYPRGRVIDLPSAEVTDTKGNTNSLEFGIQYNGLDTPNTDPNPQGWAAYVQENIVIDAKVSAMTFRGWTKYRYKAPDKNQYFIPVFKAILYQNPAVVKDGNVEIYVLQNSASEDFDLGWEVLSIPENPGNTLDALFKNEKLRKHFVTYPQLGSSWVESEQSSIKWYDFDLRVQPPPKPGIIDFYIHGMCSYTGKISNSHPPFPGKIIESGVAKDFKYPAVTNQNAIPRLQITGLDLGYIPDPNAEVPKTDYIYANGDVNYTFQEDPIRIYNGDTVDPEIVSGIVVPTNISGKKNKWDTFNNDFGKTDIGMILCKSIMQQYYKPNRLLDCDFKSDSYKYGDIIEFEHLPEIKFIMLRGSFNSKRGYWEGCTLAQITNDSIAPGGVINGDTLDPIWQETGNTRCVKDEDGLNTGESEYETQDVNSNSDSFGDFRWQTSGEDLTRCPIGTPSKYFWGTDDDTYDVFNLTDYTIVYEDPTIGQVQVSYDNVGGNYIYFLHLASLGSVVQVSNYYQSQIISSFTYLADVTINGYLYRVLRQNFVTSAFNGFLLTYYVQ